MIVVFLFLAKLEIFNAKAILKLDNNPWISQISESFKINLVQLGEYLSSDFYCLEYEKANGKLAIPPRSDRDRAKRLNKKKN